MTIICPEPANPATTDFDVSERRFTTHLRNHMNRFYPELDVSMTSVRLMNHAVRPYSQLLDFEVADNSFVRNVIYKVPFSMQDAMQDEMETSSPLNDRPRLFSGVSPISNGLREYQALESVERHFTRLNDDRFGTIPMLELIESPFVIVMEKCPDPDLKSLLRGATRFHRIQNPQILDQAFVNTGAWLREFHTLPPLEHTETRHEDRGYFADSVARFTDGLVQKTGNKSFFEDVRRRLSEAAGEILPDELPCVIVHGDFAPRNILVRSDSRVTVFDTQRRWRAPLYEDLAYLLKTLKVHGPQVRSQGTLFARRQLAAWESAVLNGYFGDAPIPLGAIRLYECLLMLEWWAAINFRHCEGTLTQRVGLALSNRYLYRHVTSLLADIESFQATNSTAL